MTPKRWQEVDDLYHAALACAGQQREALLASADSDLRREVRSLLAQQGGDRALDHPTIGAQVDSSTVMRLAPGAQLGPYQTEALLGEGGMGQVFRARDTRLNRTVAIKILSAARRAEADSADRFLREARAASALNHPNIVTVYDIGEAGGTLYIVMELIEGQTLRDLLAGGALPTPKLLAMAAQISDALAVAHAKDIVHRDLKPANVMATPEGRVKILDFGLAKTLASPRSAAESVTVSNALTQTGVIMGTLGYMSPEQARGEALDFRSDQFSFGALLYEMSTGRRAFHGATPADTLASVIRDQPEPIHKLNPQAPLPLQWAVERCLAKNPAQRYPSTRELARDLAAIAENSAPPEAAPTPHNLPAQRTGLVGREEWLATARRVALQPGTRLLTLTGPGGIGKTRLVVELGQQLLDEFRGGVFFVPLERISDPELVPSEIANAWGVRQTADRRAIALLQEHARQFCAEPTLLLLDNFEHVLASAPMVTDLLSASANLKIAVTSRAALRVYGEYELPVPPLELPDPKAGSVEALAASPGVALFLERATALGGARAVDEDQIRTVAEICARLDGVPLSIELAAARTKMLPLPALLERVRDPLQLLAGGPRDLPQRQRTLRATLDWSHNLLDAEQQKLFRRISVFIGGATTEAIEAVCNAKEDLEIDPLEGIEALVDNSLLRRTGADLTDPRFTMLETVREYGLARLAEAGEEAYTRKAHAAYAMVLAEEGGRILDGPRRQAWLSRCDAELGNFRAALDWLTAADEAQWGMRLAIALGVFFVDRGLAREGYERIAGLLALPSAAPQNKTRGWALSWACDHGFARGISDDVREPHFREGLEIFEKIGDRIGLLRVVNARGVDFRDRGDFESALEWFERAVEVARESGEPAALAGALSNMADIGRQQGEFEMARMLYAESMRLFAAANDALGEAWTLSHQGDLWLDQGNTSQARSLYEQALTRFRAKQSSAGIIGCYEDLARVAMKDGDPATAQRLLREALQLMWGEGTRVHAPRVLERLALCAVGLDEPERALTLAACSASLRQSLGYRLSEAGQTRLEASLEVARQKAPATAAVSWMRGWNMAREEAVRFALGLPSPAQTTSG